MLIDKVENLKEWLTAALEPICEADPSALAKYVVALVKKDKTLAELKDSCVDQLDVFLQAKTKPFVENLFVVLENKSYVKDEPEPVPPVPEPSEEPVAELVVPGDTPDISQLPVLSSSSDQLVTSSTAKTDLSNISIKKEDVKENEPIEPRKKSRSPSPRFRAREDERRRRSNDRRPYGRGYGRRRSPSPRPYRPGRPRSRSPFRRRSPFRSLNRSRSPRGRIRGHSRSRSRSFSRSPPLRRSWSRSRSRELRRSRSPGGRPRSRSPGGRPRSRSPGGRPRSRSPGGRVRSRSPGGRPRSPGGRPRSPGGRPANRSISPRDLRSRIRGRSPYRRSLSPRARSRSPRKRSWSPRRRSRSPVRRSASKSPRRSRSGSPYRKVLRQSPESRGPTPTQENGLVDSTNPTPTDSLSSISVLNSGARFGDIPSASRLRCRDFDEKGFCVRGDMCVYDHGSDPVVVENLPPPNFPPGRPPPGAPPHLLGPPPPGHMHVPPPGFFNRPPGPPGNLPPPRPEPYNPEAPGITRPGMHPFWMGGPEGPPPFIKDAPPQRNVPVHARLGTRGDLVNLTVKREVKEEPEDEDEEETPSSTRTVIAPKDEPLPPIITEPSPPGEESVGFRPAPEHFGRQQQPQRFHPYHQNPRFGGPRKAFDYNRVGGYRRPDTSNCSLEVRKVPPEFNNISKLNEHFGKFGTIINLQVKFEGDPEGALVTYSRNVEALNCYKCSEPVFNNRFIKVFWHQKNKTDAAGSQEQAPTSTTTPGPGGGQNDEPSHSLKSRLGPIPPASKLSLNNMVKKTPSPAPPTPAIVAATSSVDATTSFPEKRMIYTSSMGTMSMSKMAYSAAVAAATHKAKVQAQSVTSPTAVKAADFVSRMEKVKNFEEVKKEAAIKRLEIQKQKSILLEKQIEQQKKLIASIEKNKDMKEANKKILMESLKTLTSGIDKLKKELGGGRNYGVQPEPAVPSTSAAIKSPEQAKKEILDVELELMTKSGADDTADLKKKLAELTQVANNMGLLGRGRGRGTFAGRGRGSTTWVAAGLSQAVPPVVGRGRGRGGAMTGAAVAASRTLDRRPKQLEVTGFEPEEKEELSSHINALKGVENAVFSTEVSSAIVTFKTRREAELGILRGSKFKTKTLKMSWHIPKPDFSRSISSLSGDTEDQEEIDEDALLAGVEDEEEDEEDRSWRR